MDATRAKGVDSARRVLQILLSFSEASPELTVDRVAQEFDISVPSAYRYISLLRELFLIEEQRKGVYGLTSQVFRLAEVAESSLDLGAVAKPVLDRMVEETGETVLVLRRAKDSALCVASAIPDMPATISFTPGHLMPLHRGAGPKVLLASLPNERRENYLAKRTSELGEAEVALLRAELLEVSRLNHAVSRAEVDEGIFAVAAPISVEGRTVAALSIAGLAFRIDDADRVQLLKTVKAGAVEIAERFSSARTGFAAPLGQAS